MKKECIVKDRMTHVGRTPNINDTNIVVHSVRIPDYVKEYFKQHNVNIRDVLMDFYEKMQSEELPNALQEYNRLKEAVLRQEQIVIRLQTERTTKQANCNTNVFEWLKSRHDPGFYLGKTHNGVVITQEMVDKAIQEQSGGAGDGAGGDVE